MANINTSWSWAVATCNRSNVGYSQTYREQQTVNGITYYDCSSFLWYALLAGAFPVIETYGSRHPFTTSDMISVLLSMGFTEVPVSNVWKPGDILWRSGHTEMVYQGRRTMGAHTDDVPLEQQVSINTSESSPSNWSRCFRYGSGGSGVGASAYVAAAICGNWMQESTLNPGQWELGYKQGFGLGQWTDNSETNRRTQLLNWLQENGYASNDGNGQLAYFIHENIWYHSGVAANFDNLSAFLSSTSTDLSMLTEAFMRGWEGISDSSLSYRISCANTYLEYFNTHASDKPGTWYNEESYDNPSSTLLSFGSEANLNNALLIFLFFSGGDVPPLPPIKKKKKLPVWMMCRYFI